ncbi:MAG: protein kinase domain-containing protein, partial [Bryobacteraceae bacterium]
MSEGGGGELRSASLARGDLIAERYEILDELGRGGMGAVYKVRDRELDRVIALKTIRPDLASNTSTIRRFKQELLLARQISHRNVIRIYDLGVSGGLRFITMEFVDGRDLRSILSEYGKLLPEEAAGIVKQICAGLEAAHAEDVIHRDLKPQNILLDMQRQVRIMDFGLARTLEQSGITGTGMIVGTADYMSPEQARGEQIDARSDLFSLGLILYELLTGVLPFAAESMVSTLFRRTQERAEPVQSIDPSIPGWLARITMRCLEPDPSERYQSAAEIAYDLEHPNAEPARRRFASAEGFAPGALLGSRYRIQAKAGEGGMGVVYRATDLELNRTVALKVIRPELTADPRSLDRLKQEILLASRISQRNVLRIHDLGEANGLRFISMAWMEGQDLSRLIGECGPLPEERIFALGRQLCEGLDAAHAEGVVHRDLKPENILVDASGNACIGDFGLAQTAAALPETQTMQLAGTPRYMSPEQVEGKPIDQRTDIYSLGLILYEMATGAPAFATESVFQTMMRRVTEPPKNPKLANPALSDSLAQTILRCLERDPEKRYQSAREVLQALTPPAAQRKSGLPRIYLWSLAAVAAAAIAVLAFAMVHSRGTPVPPKSGKYVAVLPFRSLSADPNLKYEAEGVADAITNRLFALNGVHPISPPALERVDLSKPEGAIARQVGANLVVRGTLQSQGDRLQVIVAIDNIGTHTTIWSKSFPGMRGDLLTIEQDICNQVVGALGITPTS